MSVQQFKQALAGLDQDALAICIDSINQGPRYWADILTPGGWEARRDAAYAEAEARIQMEQLA